MDEQVITCYDCKRLFSVQAGVAHNCDPLDVVRAEIAYMAGSNTALTEGRFYDTTKQLIEIIREGR